MQAWLSSEASFDYCVALFQVLVCVRGQSLSGGGLTLYKHLELEASRLHEAKTFQGVVHSPFCFLVWAAFTHGLLSCLILHYKPQPGFPWMKQVKASEGKGHSVLTPLPPFLTSHGAEMKDMKS